MEKVIWEKVTQQYEGAVSKVRYNIKKAVKFLLLSVVVSSSTTTSIHGPAGRRSLKMESAQSV